MGAGLTPTTRFSDRVGDYAKHRPTYPRETIEAVLDGLGPRGAPRSELVIADVGAGTGISSRVLADAADARGEAPRVIAIEPNREMREGGEAVVHPGVSWREGTGEATGLPEGSVDAVVCAQAFHWLDPARALAEFRRILRASGGCAPGITPGSIPGRVALIWNTRNPDDAATEAYYDVMARHAIEGPQSPWASNDVRHNPYALPLRDSALFTGYRRLLFENEQRLSLEGLLGRARSASYVPKDGAAGEAVRKELEAAFARFSSGGVYVMRYLTETHLAEAKA